MEDRWRLGCAYDKNESFSGGKSRVVAPPTLALTTRTTAVFSGLKNQRQYWLEGNCTVSITSFDPETNTYVDRDPEEMVDYLNKLGRYVPAYALRTRGPTAS